MELLAARLRRLRSRQDGRCAAHRLNEKLCGELSRREFVAFSIAILKLSLGELEIANCGLPDPYWICDDRKAEVIDVPGSRLPLGVRRDVVYESCKLQLQAGDRFLLLTDGLPEALTPEGEPLGYEALMEIVDRPQSLEDDPSAWLDRLLEDVTRATTTENDDRPGGADAEAMPYSRP